MSCAQNISRAVLRIVINHEWNIVEIALLKLKARKLPNKLPIYDWTESVRAVPNTRRIKSGVLYSLIQVLHFLGRQSSQTGRSRAS